MDPGLVVVAVCILLAMGLTLASWGLGRWSTGYERDRLAQDVQEARAALEAARNRASERASGAKDDLARAVHLADVDSLDGLLRLFPRRGPDTPPGEPGGEADA